MSFTRILGGIVTGYLAYNYLAYNYFATTVLLRLVILRAVFSKARYSTPLFNVRSRLVTRLRDRARGILTGTYGTIN